MIITIDGPSASGKSSLARNIAKTLNVFYLNTGLLYRALGYILIKNFNYSKQNLVDPKQKDLEEIVDIQKLKYFIDGDSHIIFDNIDISNFLHLSEVSEYASIVSSNLRVRKILFDYQKQFVKHKNLVADGRDCGSVVFPEADIKIFLTASIEVRTQRWQKYLEFQGQYLPLEECKKMVIERDERDQKRVASSLVIPKDATVIDNSDLSQEQTLQKALDIVRQAGFVKKRL